MANITSQLNQSMLDVIVQAMGTLEGGMCFCELNGVSISDVPEPGTVFMVPDGTQNVGVAFNNGMVNSGVLQYLGQNGIVLGNLGTARTEVFINEAGTMDLGSEDGTDNFVSEL